MQQDPKKTPLFLRIWLLAFLLSAVFFVCMYASVQQVLRQDANDPQIQLAEDAGAAFTDGAPLDTVVSSSTVNIDQSLAPFLIVFNSDGAPVASSARLDGTVPTLPSGVFASVKSTGEDRFTWEPRSGVRIAAVVMRYSSASGSGYVLAGRSLREVEVRELAVEHLALLGLAATTLLSFIAAWILLG